MLKLLLAILDRPLLTLVLSIMFLLLNVLDAHSTYLVIRPAHYHRERNPIARWIFRKLTVPLGIIVFKTAILAIVIPAIAYYAAWDPFTINIVMLVANLLFLWVVWHNYRVYTRIAASRNPVISDQ